MGASISRKFPENASCRLVMFTRGDGILRAVFEHECFSWASCVNKGHGQLLLGNKSGCTTYSEHQRKLTSQQADLFTWLHKFQGRCLNDGLTHRALFDGLFMMTEKPLQKAHAVMYVVSKVRPMLPFKTRYQPFLKYLFPEIYYSNIF